MKIKDNSKKVKYLKNEEKNERNLRMALLTMKTNEGDLSLENIKAAINRFYQKGENESFD